MASPRCVAGYNVLTKLAMPADCTDYDWSGLHTNREIQMCRANQYYYNHIGIPVRWWSYNEITDEINEPVQWIRTLHGGNTVEAAKSRIGIDANGAADPSDPKNSRRNDGVRFVVDDKEQSWFRLSRAGAAWTDAAWADCRDPMVMKHNGIWYMFYSGTDLDGGIAGVATAPSVLGPWVDRGAVMKVEPGSIPESCFVLKAPDDTFVMTFNHAGAKPGGSKSARAKSLLPVNGKPSLSDIRPLTAQSSPLTGWAHEFLPVIGTKLLCANLTGYFVNLKDAWLYREDWGWTVGEKPSSAR